MDNIACRIFKEQIDLLTSLPNQEEAKTVLYQAIINSLNQFEKQNENQIENQFENAYVSVSDSVSVLGNSILNLLSKNIIWKEFSNNYGGKRENSGRKSNTRQVIEEDNICLPYDNHKDNSLKDKDKDKSKDKVKNNRYGECKNVLLTEEQYKNLSELDNFDLALEKLDTWLGTSGSKNRNKNHYAYFKSNSWVWKDLKPKQTETEETVFIDEHTRIDETMPEFNDMTYDECCRAFEWLQEKMYCQSMSKSKFVEIVRKFKGIK